MRREEVAPAAARRARSAEDTSTTMEPETTATESGAGGDKAALARLKRQLETKVRLQEHVVEHGRGSVQLPAEQVEAWTATSDGGFRCAGRAERIVPCSVADTLVPELCTMRLFACLTARTHLPHCARLTLAAAINSRPSSFGSAGIVALSATCKWYAGGLKDEVRRATSIVLHPHRRAAMTGILYVWKSRSRGLWEQSDVGRQSEAAWLLAPVGGCRFS